MNLSFELLYNINPWSNNIDFLSQIHKTSQTIGMLVFNLLGLMKAQYATTIMIAIMAIQLCIDLHL